MKKNRIKAYWLFLLVLLYTAAAVLSVGEAQARYVTTATWNTVVQQEEPVVTSDCLVDIHGTPLTILLGTMPRESYPVTFQLTAGEATSGNLNWTVSLPEYISVQMCIGETAITPETTIELDADESVTVTMTLTPSETAFTEVREAANVSVEVTWADALKGTFLTQLPEVEEEEEPTEETEPDPTEETQPDPTEETEPDPTEETQPDPTEETEPDPTQETEPDPTEPGADATSLWTPKTSGRTNQKSENNLTPNTESPAGEDPTEAPPETEPDPTEDPDGQSEASEDPQNPETPGEGNESEEPGTGDDPEPSEPSEPTEPVQEEVTILLDAPNSINSAASFPIQITAPENGGAIRLGLASVVKSADPEGESQTTLEGFPQYTRFSLADGEICYMLYRADTIPLNLADGETVSLVLDLSHVQLEQFQVILGAAPQVEEAAITTYTATVIPESIQFTSVSSRILSVGAPLTITFSEFWKDYELDYTLEMLATIPSGDGEKEILGYVPAELPENCLNFEVTSDETGTKVIFSIGQTLPPAGTYRVSLNWISEGTCYAQMQETFFINYSLNTESEKTGGAEQ